MSLICIISDGIRLTGQLKLQQVHDSKKTDFNIENKQNALHGQRSHFYFDCITGTKKLYSSILKVCGNCSYFDRFYKVTSDNVQKWIYHHKTNYSGFI